MPRAKEFKEKVTIGVNLEKEELDLLDEIRWREHEDVSSITRKAIQEYIKAHGEGNSTFKLDKWNDDPNFKAVPTIMSSQETWYKYLNECTNKERLDIQIKATHINEQCKFIKGENVEFN